MTSAPNANMEYTRQRALNLRLAAASTRHRLLTVLEEAREFVRDHSEDWYFSGQELLGKLDSVIEVERAKQAIEKEVNS